MNGNHKFNPEQLRQKPVRELRVILTRRKVDVTGIADKEEFIRLIMQSEHLEPSGNI